MADTTEQPPRQSCRAKWTRGYIHKHEADENTNTDKLWAYPVERMGYGLFTKQKFSISVRLLCVYHRRKISRKKAYTKHNKSNYIVEVLNHYALTAGMTHEWYATKKVATQTTQKDEKENKAVGMLSSQ